MENSINEVKLIADYTTLSNDHGVANVISKICNNLTDDYKY